MTTGKLSVIKTYGERPVWVILDKDGKVAMMIPDLEAWLMERIGTTLSINISDFSFQLTDDDKRKKLGR